MKGLGWLFAAGLLVVVGAAAPVPIDPADREALAAYEASVDALRTTATPAAFQQIREVELICWNWCPQFERALVAYRLSGDKRHLATFVQAIEALQTRLSRGPEGRLGFRGVPLERFRDPASKELVEVNIAEFAVVHVLAEFVEIVRGEPGLAAEFGAAADRYLALAVNDLAGDKWEKRGDYVDLGTTGAVFRMAAGCNAARRHLTDPHNKQSKICRAYLALYRVTGDDEYFRKAVKLGTRFKHTLRLEQGRYLWHYWDPAGEWDREAGKPAGLRHWVGAEHRSGYHQLTMDMVEALYDHGVVFTRADLGRFVATQKEICWNGSLDAPKFFRTDGRPGTERGQTNFMATSLARFDPKLWRYCFDQPGSSKGRTHLKAKYLLPHAAEPQRAHLRRQFERKPENAMFLRELEFEVRPAGGP